MNLIKKYKVLIFIFLLAFALRVYKLGSIPYGFHNDEVKVGWNALSILKTGRDDRGNKLALYYNSFGDYRPTGIFYATLPSIAVFGRSEFATRFPSSLLGALTILPFYFLTFLLTKKKSVAEIASLFLALSPWHISTSRATSEVVISLFLVFCGLYFLFKFIEGRKTKDLILSGLGLFLSYFFYHTARLLTPAFLFVILAFKYKGIKKEKIFKSLLIFFAGFSLFTFILALNKEARGRFSQVSIFSDLNVKYELSRMPFEEGQNKVFIARAFHNKVSTYSRRFINEYANYFSANFFLNSQIGKPDRYTTIGVGVLTYVELALFLCGLIFIAQKRGSLLPLLLLLVAPIPAALTTEDAPNLHRALYMIPFILIIAAYGFEYLTSLSKKHENLIKKVIFLGVALNTIFFLHMYVVHNRVHLPLYRNVGAKELALELNKIQKDYDKIILTNIPDDLYPWIAFLTNKDPKTFNADAVKREKGNWSTENYFFTGLRCPSRDAFIQPDVKRLLVVDAEGCAKESNLVNRTDVKLIETIQRPDETEVYTLWSRIE
jgi:4-amino-4-deoxy-L-arabinose transferase-like glycosyltransferase